jgi:hypothetical protein
VEPGAEASAGGADSTLQSLFASVGSGEPVLMDLSNLEGMGTALHPLFAASAPAARHLEAAGIPRNCLYEDLELARAALLGV